MEFIEKLAATSSPEETHRVLVEEARRLGASDVSHRCGPNPELLQTRTSLPDAWARYYRDERFAEVDPGPRHAAHSTRAVAFHFDEPRPAISPSIPFTERARMLFEELRGAGIEGSYFVPIARPGDRPISMVSFFSANRRRAFDCWIEERAGLLRLVAAAANARMLELERPEPRKSALAPLAPRETETLAWLASGLRVERIAERMGVSGRTVEFHLGNARRKLGAATREEALARAIMLGLIAP